MSSAGFNMIVLELGDAIAWRSHPELAVRNAWSLTRLRSEQMRLRDLGIELIPKFNFSSSHDIWLGVYGRQVATERYYQVCRDLITEAIEILDAPAYLHLGMDEEGIEHQHAYNYISSRHFELFWHDLTLLCEHVHAHGVRPWIFSDALWKDREAFGHNISKHVLQSNWYYGVNFDESEQDGTVRNHATAVQAYRDLVALGYDQVPCYSNWQHRSNMRRSVEFARKVIPTEKLKGYLHNGCYPMTPEYESLHEEAIATTQALGLNG